MPRLNTLKNNSKGREALDNMISGKSPHHWMVETLASLKHVENLLPWKKLLLNYEEDVRILAMHKDSYLRYHGCSIILYSQNEDSRRHLWEMFRDSERSIRILMIRRFQSADRHRLYNTLFKIYLNDPIAEVRQSAYRRITQDFSDLYSIQITALSLEEKIHCLELMNLKSSHDHNLALELMNDSQPGVVLAAGLYLEKTGTLDRLIRRGRLRDLEDIHRRIVLLQTAAEHQLISFLEKKENLENPGALLIALSLYENGVHSNLFAWSLKQIFELQQDMKIHREMKKRAAICLCGQKDPDSLILIRDLLLKKNDVSLPYLLEHLPSEGAVIYYPVLKEFILDANFNNTRELFNAFRSIPVNLCLSDLFSLIKEPNYSIEVRRKSLIILSSYCEYSCTLFMLENLNLLKKDEMQDLAGSIPSWNRKAFEKNVQLIFSQADAALHRSLMELISSAGESCFIPEIEEKLLSPEAETRISALHSLQELDSKTSIEKMKGLFYDSEKTVQAHTAAVFIEWNEEMCFEEIESLLQDNFEFPEVQNIILNAAAESDNIKLIPIIISLLKKDGISRDLLLKTLKEKQKTSEIRLMTSLYGSLNSYGKESLQMLFKSMKNQVETVLMELLKENVYSTEIKEILEKTGYVRRMIDDLKSPFLQKRRDAADALCSISTKTACRGLLTAARDISSDIRKKSLTALSRAQSSIGVLSLLKEDPDKKVRRQAQWAESKIEKAGIQ